MDSAVGFIGKDKIDAYVKTEFKKKKLATDMIVQEKGGKPVNWNKEFWLPAQVPILVNTIEFRLMDKEEMTFDETAGSFVLKTKHLIENCHGENGMFIWKNFYGSPLGIHGNGKFKTEMNLNPDTASDWKGRVLIQCVAEATDKPLH